MHKFKLLIVFIFSTLFFFCSREKKPEIPQEEIIAKVGDHIITAKEFKFSFEFSPSPLRLGYNPRQIFLQYMLKEKLLALEGYKQGFHKSPYVTRRMRHRRYNDLLEAFYLKYIHGQVNIPEDKLKEAVKKGSVTWRMRIWPTETLEEAKQALAEAREIGLSNYMKKQFAKQEIPIDEQKYYQTDWIDFLEVRPEILDRIKNLEVGEISEPIPFDNDYALFQVLDIQRSGIKSDELERGVKRKKMEARLHNIQADSIVHALMDSILTPMDVRVSSKIVDKLAPALYSWIKERLPMGISLLDVISEPDTTKKYLAEIRELLNETLVNYNGGKKTVRDYILYMDYFRRELKHRETLEEFRNVLLTEIGRMVKNDTFVEIAEKEGFLDSADIAKDMRLWEEKWTYDVFRNHLVKDIEVTETELLDYFKQHWRDLDIADVDTTKFWKYRVEVHADLLHQKHINRLENELVELRQRYPIWINEKRLNELELSDGLQERNISFFVVKRFSRKPVIPTVDLKWLYF